MTAEVVEQFGHLWIFHCARTWPLFHDEAVGLYRLHESANAVVAFQNLHVVPILL